MFCRGLWRKGLGNFGEESNRRIFFSTVRAGLPKLPWGGWRWAFGGPRLRTKHCAGMQDGLREAHTPKPIRRLAFPGAGGDTPPPASQGPGTVVRGVA